MLTTMTIEPLTKFTKTKESNYLDAIEGTDVEEVNLKVTCTLADYASVTNTYEFQVNIQSELSRRELQDDEMNCENDFIQLEEPFVAD